METITDTSNNGSTPNRMKISGGENRDKQFINVLKIIYFPENTENTQELTQVTDNLRSTSPEFFSFDKNIEEIDHNHVQEMSIHPWMFSSDITHFRYHFNQQE